MNKPLKGKRELKEVSCPPEYNCTCSNEKRFLYYEEDVASAVELVKEEPSFNLKQDGVIVDKIFIISEKRMNEIFEDVIKNE